MTDPSKEPRRGPGKRAGLTTEDVVRAAKQVYHQDGLSGLTMRSVARELGVAANTLYSHVSSKTALLDLLIDTVLADVVLPQESDDWLDGLIALMSSSRAVLLTHASLMPHFLSRPTRGPNATRLGEATLTLLERGGVSASDGVLCLRVLLVYTIGFAAQEAPRLMESQAERREEQTRKVLSKEHEHARMRAAADQIAQHPGEEVFLAGLRWLLEGIARHGGQMPLRL